MKTISRFVIAAALLAATPLQAADDRAAKRPDDIERGRYLVRTAGCNDCHTPGYDRAAGKVPEKQWLVGANVGFRGPWGTTYASNLRLYFSRMTEEAFIADARSGRMRPPMPWFNLRDMTDSDLRSIHAYVRSLGPAGAPAPAYAAPKVEPSAPYYLLEPQQPQAVARAR